MRTLPTFLLVGAMRSGTTSLMRSLGAHPDVFVAPQKEIHFFDRHFARGVDWYADQFRGAAGAAAIGEGTPLYMYDDAAVRRMADVVPDARLLVVLRDPVDRAYSHYWHNRTRAREPLSFVDAIAAEGSREPLARYAYVERGQYLPQLERLVRHYPREQVHVLLLDDLRERPDQTFAAVARFVGVDDTFVPPVLGESVNRYYEYRSQLAFRAARRLPKRAGDAIGRINRVDRTYPALGPEVRAQLAGRFADDIAALASFLDRDLSAWRA